MINGSEQSVLDLIRRRRANTQADLCRLTGARSSTMTYILARLRRKKLVRSSGTRIVGRGKPATVLRFDPGGFIACIELDGAHALIGLMDFGGAMTSFKRLGIKTYPSPEKLLRTCRLELLSMLKAKRIGVSRVRALGVSVNGRVSSDGTLEFSTVLPWRNIALRDMAQRQFAFPVFVSSLHSRAVAEYRYGAGNGSRCMLHFNVGDGVSARPVVDGELYVGGTGNSGEIGHIVMRPNGPLCGCGQRGCLESLISGPAICQRILDDAANLAPAREAAPESLIGPARRGAAIAMTDELVRLAESGDSAYARDLLKEIIELAGRGLAMASACFGPDRIVIDGYFFRNHPALVDRLSSAAAANLGMAESMIGELVPSALGDDAGLIALGTLVADGLAARAIDGHSLRHRGARR